MFGYIVPDAIIKQLSEKLSDKTYSPRQVNVLSDVDAKPEIFNKGTAPITPAAVAMGSTYNVTNTSITQGLDPLIQTYLNTNKAVESTNVTVPDTVTFAANFLAAPSGLPTTSKTSFTFFINSLYVEPSAVTSFTNPTNGVCTLVLDTGVLGYTLINGDLIVAVGKFE